MLQIRLNKAPSSADAGAGGGGAPSAKPPPLAAAAEAGVTVACPEHLILADLPVAKSLGAVTSSAVASSRSVARRSRRSPGQKVHFCVRCDFPIAIYGRLIPCEHSFCLACARNDSSCYLCDERIQKIQTIKMMEGIYICAAPHCLKTFLKKPEFQAHVHDAHADLVHPKAETEGATETEPMNIVKPSSADPPHTQSSQPESSTARAPPRSGVSPSSNSQTLDREDRSRRNQSRDQPPPKPPLQPRPPPQQSRQQPGDLQSDTNLPQGLQKQPQNWSHQPQNPENQSGSQSQHRRDADQLPQDKQAAVSQDSSLPTYPPSTPQPPNYPFPLNANQALAPTPSFSYPFPTEGSQSYYNVPEGGSEQGSVLGIPPAPTVAGFPDNFRPPWGMTLMGMPFTPMQVGQGIPEGFANNADPQGRIQFSQGDYGRVPEALPMNPLAGKELDQRGGSADQEAKGMLAPMQMPLQFPHGLPPPPPLPPPIQQHPNSNNFSGQEGQMYGWQNDSR